MKSFAKLSTIIFFVVLPSLTYAGFDWGGDNGSCSGSGNFQQQIKNNAIVKVGEIPSGKEGVYIKLTSEKDVDIQLYDKTTGKKIIHWPNGLLNGPNKQTTNYQGVSIEWSGYNGDGSNYGHEYIKITNTTNRNLVMKAYGYEAGFAKVNYSWSGTAGCSSGGGGTSESGSGTFQQQILKKAIITVGDIPEGLADLSIELKSNKDVDIQLYDKDNGQKIIVWPDGLLKGSGKQSINYRGMSIEWSGYNGDGTGKGNEYIRISGKTTRNLVMKAYGYQAGYATVNYSWGNLKKGICSSKKAKNLAHKDPSPTMCISTSYSPSKAVEYAHLYYDTPYGGYGNKYHDFGGEVSGGNCTNFVNQALVAGLIGIADNTAVYNARFTYVDSGYLVNGIEYNAWYYTSINNRSPEWTGAHMFYQYAKSQSEHPNHKGMHFKKITDDKTDWLKYKEIKIGDIIFADWPKLNGEINENGTVDGRIDHSMIVVNTQSWRSGYNEIRVTYQSTNTENRGLGDINEQYKHKAIFYVFRPTGFSN